MYYLNKKEINDEYNLSELGIIDLFIISLIDSPNFYLEYISNLFELELYRKSNDLKLYEYPEKQFFINGSTNILYVTPLLTGLPGREKTYFFFSEFK